MKAAKKDLYHKERLQVARVIEYLDFLGRITHNDESSFDVNNEEDLDDLLKYLSEIK